MIMHDSPSNPCPCLRLASLTALLVLLACEPQGYPPTPEKGPSTVDSNPNTHDPDTRPPDLTRPTPIDPSPRSPQSIAGPCSVTLEHDPVRQALILLFSDEVIRPHVLDDGRRLEFGCPPADDRDGNLIVERINGTIGYASISIRDGETSVGHLEPGLPPDLDPQSRMLVEHLFRRPIDPPPPPPPPPPGEPIPIPVKFNTFVLNWVELRIRGRADQRTQYADLNPFDEKQLVADTYVLHARLEVGGAWQPAGKLVIEDDATSCLVNMLDGPVRANVVCKGG